MIYLKPITLDNINDFKNTSYDNMTLEQKEKMITESINKIHNNMYFEFLVAYKNDVVIGFMNLFAHSLQIKKFFKGLSLKFIIQKRTIIIEFMILLW